MTRKSQATRARVHVSVIAEEVKPAPAPTDAELVEMLCASTDPWIPENPMVKRLLRWMKTATYWRERCMVLEERLATHKRTC
jgi:hypothetical protein